MANLWADGLWAPGLWADGLWFEDVEAIPFIGESSGADQLQWTGHAGSMEIGYAALEGQAGAYQWTGYPGQLFLAARFDGESTDADYLEWTGHAGSYSAGWTGEGQASDYQWQGFPGSISGLGYNALEGQAGEYHWRGYTGFFFNGERPPAPPAEQVNDCTFEVLGFYGFTGDLNDRLLAYYRQAGATAFNIDDAEYEFLLLQGVAPAQINDMWLELFELRGYPTKTYNEGMYHFWCIDGGINA